MKQCESIHMVVNLIEKQRKSKFPNKQDFAYHLNMQPSRYSRFMKGKAAPTMPEFLQMCKELGLDEGLVLKNAREGRVKKYLWTMPIPPQNDSGLFA
ncbi:MAG: helix-turn-helix transcriptional regulator [Bacteroidetes bacterium]|nr:helix-turn-helix transcriptional regulator [Bacteroidota bacterium]